MFFQIRVSRYQFKPCSIRLLLICLGLMSAISVGACGANAEQSSLNNETNNQEKSNNEGISTMTINGTLVYQHFEGGFFGFISDSGEKYILSGLDKEFKKNGIILELEVSEMKGLATTQQFGKLLKVHKTKVLDVSKIKPSDNSM